LVPTSSSGAPRLTHHPHKSPSSSPAPQKDAHEPPGAGPIEPPPPLEKDAHEPAGARLIEPSPPPPPQKDAHEPPGAGLIEAPPPPPQKEAPPQKAKTSAVSTIWT
jgi:hypothetical protein